jgi:hypothetical protein
VPLVIQQAVAATADTYRDQLQEMLERQDGPDWLDALNRRRRHDMLAAGKHPPEPYRSFEPRAVINCLAYDPGGLQLIPGQDVGKVRQLSGLSVSAHHPDPNNPPTEEDARRAWRLYSEITGRPQPTDPFDL